MFSGSVFDTLNYLWLASWHPRNVLFGCAAEIFELLPQGDSSVSTNAVFYPTWSRGRWVCSLLALEIIPTGKLPSDLSLLAVPSECGASRLAHLNAFHSMCFYGRFFFGILFSDRCCQCGFGIFYTNSHIMVDCRLLKKRQEWTQSCCFFCTITSHRIPSPKPYFQM